MNTFLDRITVRRTALCAAIITLAVYLLTLSPTFGFIDKGELVADATTLGIAHPTGYPTIMLLGFLFTKIVPLRPVVSLNTMSAILGSIGIGIMTLLFYDLAGRIGRERTP